MVVKTRSGRMIAGVLKNQDNFSVQLASLQADLISIERGDIVSLQFETGPLIAGETIRNLTADELQNLLAYLDRQRAPFQHREIGFQTY